MAIHEEKPKTLSEFMEIIESIQNNSGLYLWYRGSSNSNYELIPSLYRHRYKKSKIELAELEHQLMTQFRLRSIPYVKNNFNDPWDLTFFMQHYGIPTRLLDWTENPLTALHFALINSPHIRRKRENIIIYTQDAIVWVLNPREWNQFALSHQSFSGGVLTPGDEALKGYKPELDFSIMNNFPVAIHGARNSPRIVAQQGVFTIFGQNTSPMEIIFEVSGFPENALKKIILEKQNIERIRNALLINGVTESVVFPDLEGLSQEIKRKFDFME